MRRLLLLLPLLPLLLPAPVAAQEAVAVRVLQANLGNVNVASGGCGDQAVKLCLLPVEQRLIGRLAEIEPQVALLQELLPALVCDPPVKPGDFGTPPTSASLRNPNHLCNPAVRAQLSAPEQLDRLLPPQQWETRCNAPLIDPAAPQRVIPPWDCIGVRRDVGRIVSFTSLLGTAPAAVPGETCDNGFTTNAAVLQLGGRRLQVTLAHPDSGSARAGCRAEKLARLFDALGGTAPALPTVVAGDFNLDPYRSPDVSTELWDRFVSRDGATTPYRYLTGIAEADPPPFTSNFCGLSQEDPTGLVLDGVQPPAPPCASSLDHVAVSRDVQGSCDTLGEPPGTSARLDGGGHTDHRGLLCDLVLPAGQVPAAAGRTPAAAGTAPAAAGTAPAAAGTAPAPRAPSASSLPATGPGVLSSVGAGLLVVAAVVARRRRSTARH